MQSLVDTYASQYANSPVLLSIIERFNSAVDPASDINAFFDKIWNIDSAVGYGLDVWGRIVGIGRSVAVPSSGTFFGFNVTGASTQPFKPWNQAVFRSSLSVQSTYLLSDAAYRALILTKAFANVAASDIPTLNTVARMIAMTAGIAGYVDAGYVDEGYFELSASSRAYVTDAGGMAMTYVFPASLTVIQKSIVAVPGLLPRPAGVAVSLTFL